MHKNMANFLHPQFILIFEEFRQLYQESRLTKFLAAGENFKDWVVVEATCCVRVLNDC